MLQNHQITGSWYQWVIHQWLIILKIYTSAHCVLKATNLKGTWLATETTSVTDRVNSNVLIAHDTVLITTENSPKSGSISELITKMWYCFVMIAGVKKLCFRSIWTTEWMRYILIKKYHWLKAFGQWSIVRIYFSYNKFR